jgi:5-methylcytosine-specific restriction endonuclease McrA
MKIEKENYAEFLRDVCWQKKRLIIMSRDKWSCVQCGWNEGTLHVHHKYYIPEKKPWEYPNSALITLCEVCHNWEKQKNG